jgi:asparagine synthase (glutamine-hydrolysing)
MRDQLVAAMFDLSGGRWFAGDGERAVRTLVPGKAGDVRMGEVPGALLAARAFGPLPSGRASRIARAVWTLDELGEYTLFAGQLHDRDALIAAHGLDPALDNAALYAALAVRLGENCDRAINGNYAAIRWSPAERRLRLARSHVSHYPLHIWRDGDRVAVASLPRTLFALGASSRVNDEKLADCMLLNLSEQSDSWYTDLSRSHCGMVTTIDRGGTRSNRYWSYDTIRPVRFKRDEDYVEAVDEQFRRAVRATIADVAKPAMYLSGGFDSQAVASYLVDELPAGAKLPAYTSVPLEGYSNRVGEEFYTHEGPYVEALAAMYPQIELNLIDGREAPLEDGLEQMVMLGSWPVHNPMGASWAMTALRKAAAAGCDAILCPVAGNPTFSYTGHTGYPTWLRTGRWLRLLREIRRARDPRPLWRRFLALAVRPNLPPAWQTRVDAARGHHVPVFESWSPLREEFARSSGAVERARAIGHDVEFQPFRASRQFREDWLRVSTTEGPEMRTALNLMFGVEERDPLVYRPFLELCFGIGDEQFLRDGTDRWLGRRLLAGRVPEMVYAENRIGFINGDWPLRFERERAQIARDLDSFAADDRLAAMLDFDRMRAALAAWPGPGGDQRRFVSQVWLPIARGIATARFVRHAEGRNAG